jgi:uncharacterized protein
MRRALLAGVRFYQRAVSPALPPRCRFYPTCSAYAAEAIEVHGAGRGTWLSARRLLKCAPWHPGGVDLVPPRRGAGTLDHRPSSSTEVPATGSDGAVRRPSTTPPAPARTAQEESSLA